MLSKAYVANKPACPVCPACRQAGDRQIGYHLSETATILSQVSVDQDGSLRLRTSRLPFSGENRCLYFYRKDSRMTSLKGDLKGGI